MGKTKNTFLENLLSSHHTFNEDETLLKYQYRVLNTILILMGLFTFMFGALSVTNINYLGSEQEISNFILTVASAVLIVLLRGSKSRYNIIAYAMYFFAYLNFLGTLFFVPHDEFRIIWFFLLMFAAYVTGGITAGNIVSVVSIATILIVNFLYGLNLSHVAVTTITVSLVIAALFFRSYTKKINNFEADLIKQKQMMITQSRFAAMGEMLSMIAHQWRQPLSTTTLLISKERVKLMMEAKEDKEFSETLDKISDTMLYLSDTIDDFQTFFKPERSKQTVEIERLIEKINQFIQPRIYTTDIKFEIICCDRGELEIYTNELVQSLINIINNAIDVLLEKNIENPYITISFDNSSEYISIHIEDNGGGIDEKIIDNIYEPYFSTKSKNGTGLGLYMSKMIIEQHMDGELSVHNTQSGARFSITLQKKV